MPLLTTTIGAYPKPDFLPVPDWFVVEDGPSSKRPTATYLAALAEMGEEAEALFVRATEAVIEDQLSVGIDIPTDGEVRRENYIHYHCRQLEGFDFETLTKRELRNGAYVASLPSIVGPVKAKATFPASGVAASPSPSRTVRSRSPCRGP